MSNALSAQNLVDCLVDMNEKAQNAPFEIDLVYADAAHPENIFKTAIYRENARLYLHHDLARIVENAANRCYQSYGWKLLLKDGLRPIEAQAAMTQTDIVRTNPHWLVEPRLLSPAGAGAHPRGMAIDLVPISKSGQTIDMGTVFDHLCEDPAHNPAARNYQDLPTEILENRRRLEQAMTQAAKQLNLPLLPLPQEWWDFRFPPEYSKDFPALSDFDLPENKRMMPR